MTREEKIKLLTAIQKGVPLKEALPSVPEYFIEYEKDFFYYDHPISGHRNIPAAELSAYIEQLKVASSSRIINPVVIDHNEYIELSTQLEKEY